MESRDTFYLYLIRHGITEWNKEKRYVGHTDIPVLKEELAQYDSLKACLQNQPIQFVFCSDLMRCQQTASYLFPTLSITYDKRLREMFFGDWEGFTYEQLKDNPSYRKWIDNWENRAPENGESGWQFKERIICFLAEVIYPEIHCKKGDGIGVIMTHGGVIRLLMTILIPHHSYWDTETPFGKARILKFVKKEGEWICESSLVAPTQEKGNL